MPALWRPHDCDRGVRVRLRTEVAADAEQDRYVMSQTSCERCGFPVPMRWRRAGGDLARLNHLDQCAERPFQVPAEVPYRMPAGRFLCIAPRVTEIGYRRSI